MTAEVAILNLEAVALAADSAVTVERADDGPSKIFTSANKIFSLSSVAPVGILVYDTADFSGIPWETLIKEYRRANRGLTFDSLQEYAEDFRRFLLSDLPSYNDTTAPSPDAATSGIAIAGFGEKELFPSLSILQVNTKGNEADIQEIDFTKVGVNNRSAIIPFAQRDIIDQFMRGVPFEYNEYIVGLVGELLESHTGNIIDTLGSEFSGIDKEAIYQSISSSFHQIAEGFINEMLGFSKLNFVDPIMSTVTILPKEQLAEMAESLVSITALKRRVSPDEETVGGPTDVAIITKGDGMVWIKRKQYFQPELNPAYFARTYGRSS